VNPSSNRVYVANSGDNTVTVIDGLTNLTTTVPVDSNPVAITVNPMTDKVYVANRGSNDVTVIDGASLDTTLAPTAEPPQAIAVNSRTNKVYVVGDRNAFEIDGATLETRMMPVGLYPCAVAVNSLTNRIYVANRGAQDITAIDGLTYTSWPEYSGRAPCALAVNPVTKHVYVANSGDSSASVVRDAAATRETGVRAELDQAQSCTTLLARPVICGKAVNRWGPYRNPILGVLNRVGTTLEAWNWAQVTQGQGTDSTQWAWSWGDDSLVWGENYLCCVPLEAQVGTTNNLGVGSPGTGNTLILPIYRVQTYTGCENAERPLPERYELNVRPSLIRNSAQIRYALPREGNASLKLYDIKGALVRRLVEGRSKPGDYNVKLDAGNLARGVYFLRLEATGQPAITRKLIRE